MDFLRTTSNSPNVDYVCYTIGEENNTGLWLFNIEYYISFQMMTPFSEKGMDESMSIHFTFDEKEILSTNGGFNNIKVQHIYQWTQWKSIKKRM